MSPIQPANNAISTFGDNIVLDTDYIGNSIFSLVGGGALTLWASTDGGSSWNSYSVSTSSVISASIKVVQGSSNTANIYIAYFDTANNLHYCYATSSNFTFTCQDIDTSSAPAITDWIDIDYDEAINKPIIEYSVDDSGNYWVRVVTPDGTLDQNIISAPGAKEGINLQHVNNKLGSVFFNSDSGVTKIYFTPDVETASSATPLTACTFSQYPNDPQTSIPPQISDDGKTVFYFGENMELYYGVYFSEQNCWVFDNIISYSALSDEAITKMDTLYTLEPGYFRIGYQGFTFLRNMGIDFVLDVGITY